MINCIEGMEQFYCSGCDTQWRDGATGNAWCPKCKDGLDATLSLIGQLQEQNKKLQKDLDKAVKYLEFYGDKQNHKHKRIVGEDGEDVLLAPAFMDQGRRARACLEELRGE